jgi:cytochrome c551/c552
MNKKNLSLALASLIVALSASAPAFAQVDEADAMKLLKDSKCTKCHDVVKTKKGKPYQKVAAELKGKPDALAEVTKHMTEPSQVEVEGEKVDHGQVKTRDAARIKNLAEWILSR